MPKSLRETWREMDWVRACGTVLILGTIIMALIMGLLMKLLGAF